MTSVCAFKGYDKFILEWSVWQKSIGWLEISQIQKEGFAHYHIGGEMRHV